MSLSIQVPTVGQANSTEAVKVTNSLTNLSSWANGNIPGSDLSSSAAIADTQLASPNNSVRRLLLTANGSVPGGTVFNSVAGSDFGVGSGAIYLTSSSQNYGAVPFWYPDSGLSSQPTDFAVAGKSRKARVRATIMVNATTPSVNVTFQLYQVSAVAGGAGGMTITSASVGGSTAGVTNPLASTFSGVESAEFSLPTTGGPCFLGLNLQGGSGSTAANSYVVGCVQLYCYNA